MSETSGGIERSGLAQLERALDLCRRLFRAALLLALLALGISGIHSISPGKEGRVQRMGRWLEERELPGLHLAWPAPLDRVFEFDLSSMRGIEVEDFMPLAALPGMAPSSRALLTRDGHIVHARWKLGYRLETPILTQGFAAPVDSLLRALFKGCCIRVAASLDVDDILGNPDHWRQRVQNVMRVELARLSTGLRLERVDLLETRVPEAVRPAFEEVQKAALEKERGLIEARSAAQGLARSLEARRSERLGAARAEAAVLKAGLEAEALAVRNLLEKVPPAQRDVVLANMLQEALGRAAAANGDQNYLLRSGTDLKIRLGRDPLVEKLRRDRERLSRKQREKSGDRAHE